MVFARAGWSVRITDSAPSQLVVARDLIARSLAEQEQAGLADDARAALARIEISASLADAVAGVAWVQENLPEDVETKRTVFAELDRLAPAEAHPGQQHVGDRCLAVHGGACRPRALPRRASGQSAAPGAGGRAVRRAVDQRSDARERDRRS